MRLEAKKHLEDIRRAATAVLAFTRGKCVEDYVGSELLRSGGERQFQIMGEALSRLRRSDPDIAEGIEHHRRIIAFRNVLVHGYDMINDRVVWDIIEQDLPALHARVIELLAQD